MCLWSDGDKLGDLLKGSELSHCVLEVKSLKKERGKNGRKEVLDYEINLSWN